MTLHACPPTPLLKQRRTRIVATVGPGKYILLLAGFGKAEPSIRVLPV